MICVKRSSRLVVVKLEIAQSGSLGDRQKIGYLKRAPLAGFAQIELQFKSSPIKRLKSLFERCVCSLIDLSCPALVSFFLIITPTDKLSKLCQARNDHVLH